MALTELLANALYAAIIPELNELAKAGGGIPEQDGRRGMLELFERGVLILTDSYGLIFAADSGRGRFWYARVRPRAYRCACRPLELIKLHHRIVGLR